MRGGCIARVALALTLVACGGRIADDVLPEDAASVIDSTADHALSDAGVVVDATVSDATPIDASNWPMNNGYEQCNLFVDGQGTGYWMSVLAYLSQPQTLAFGCHGYTSSNKSLAYTFFAGVRVDTKEPQWAEVDVGGTAHVASASDLQTCVFAPGGQLVVDASVAVDFSCNSVEGVTVNGKLVTSLSPGPP